MFSKSFALYFMFFIDLALVVLSELRVPIRIIASPFSAT